MELNDVKIFGRVVRDAQIKTVSDSLKVSSFSVATNRFYKNEKGESVSEADFFPVTVFGSYAEKICPKLLKGQRVIIDGFLRQSRWEKDGAKRSSIGIVARHIQLISDSKAKAAMTDSVEVKPEEDLIYEYEDNPDISNDIYDDSDIQEDYS